MRQRINGPLGMLAGFTIFSFVPILVKVATNHGAGPAVGVLIRFAVGLACAAALVAFARQRIRTRNRKLLALRGLFGGTAVMLFFVSVAATGAGMGTLLNYTHSIWGNVLAVLVHRRKPPRGFWLLLAAAVAGLYLVIDPKASFEKPVEFWGALAGLLSGVLGGAAILCIKKLRETDSALTVLFSFTVAGFLVACLVLSQNVLRGHFRPLQAGFAWPAVGALVLMGLIAFGGHMMFTSGYKNTSIQLGTLLSLLTPVLAVINGHLFLGERITLRFVLGAALILGACLGASSMEKRQVAEP